MLEARQFSTVTLSEWPTKFFFTQQHFIFCSILAALDQDSPYTRQNSKTSIYGFGPCARQEEVIGPPNHCLIFLVTCPAYTSSTLFLEPASWVYYLGKKWGVEATNPTIVSLPFVVKNLGLINSACWGL